MNEPPYDICLTNENIDEDNEVGEAVGELKATDPDSQKVFIYSQAC